MSEVDKLMDRYNKIPRGSDEEAEVTREIIPRLENYCRKLEQKIFFFELKYGKPDE